MELEEVQEYFTQTRERIRQIEVKALNRLFPGYSDLKSQTDKLRAEKGSEPTDEEIAIGLGWPLEKVTKMKNDVDKYNKESELKLKNLSPEDLEKMNADTEKMFLKYFSQEDLERIKIDNDKKYEDILKKTKD